jgi:hypothetical protein
MGSWKLVCMQPGHEASRPVKQEVLLISRDNPVRHKLRA